MGFVLACIGLTAIHVIVSRRGPDYAGPLLFLDHLFDVGITLAFLLICSGVGRYSLFRAGVRFDDPIEAIVFAAATGSGLVGTIILLLGLVGGLQSITLGFVTVSLAILARKEICELPRLIGRAASQLRCKERQEPVTYVGLLVFGLIAVLLLILAAAPPVDWDTLMYQIRLPSQFLEKGHVFVPEDNLHVSRTGLVNMLYIPLLAAGSASTPAVLSGCMALLLGVAVFSFCLRYLGKRTAGLCLVGLWGSTTIVLVAVTPRVDVTLALFLFLAHYALLMSLLSTRDRLHFCLAAVLLGFAFGIKFHAIPYIAGLLPLVFWTAWVQAEKPSKTSKSLIVFGMLLIGVSLPWLVKNWILLRAPLYPFFSERILQSWLVPFYGVREVPRFVNSDIYDWIWQLREPFNLRDAFFAPGRLTIELEGSWYFANPILLVLPLCVFFIRKRVIIWLLVPAVLYLLLLLIPFPRTNLRYLLPAVVPLSIASFHAVSSLSDRPFTWNRVLSVLLVVIALFPSARAMHMLLDSAEAVSHFFGVISRADYLRDHPSTAELTAMKEVVNRHLPLGSRTLMIFEARGYYFQKNVIQDTSGTNLPLIMARPGGDPCLGGSGISHVLLNKGALAYYLDAGLDQDLIRWDEFERFREACLQSIHETPGYALYRLRESGDGSPIE